MKDEAKKKEIIDFTGKIASLGRELIDEVIKVIEEQQKEIKVDLFSPEKDQVINGLFFRTLRFYHSFVISFHFWSMDMSEIITRSMLESKYYLKFLLDNDKEEFYQEFVKYGIGQEKLYKLHLARLIDEGKIEKTDSLVDFIDSQSDDEIWDELVSIKLKNFDDIRKIADSIGEKDSYSLEYQPYSITIHGQWPALRKFYLRRCEDPLHRFHYIGTTQLPPLDPRTLFQTEAIFYDTYLLWIKHYGLEDKIKPLLDNYAKKLDSIFSMEEKLRKGTVCFIQDGNSILLALIEYASTDRKWNGIGGFAEEGESLEEAVVREASEETEISLDKNDLKRVAELNFSPSFQLNVFLASKWSGELNIKDSSLKELKWFPKSDLPYEQMHEGNRDWLEPTLKGKLVRLVDNKLEEVSSFE